MTTETLVCATMYGEETQEDVGGEGRSDEGQRDESALY